MELDPEGVLGIWWWKAGACRLNRLEPLLDTPCPEDELCEGTLYWWERGWGMVSGGGRVSGSGWDGSGPYGRVNGIAARRGKRRTM